MEKKITTPLTKLYYSIGEVADMFGVSKSLIRHWEAEFETLKPHKNSKGDRRFTPQNIEQLAQIYTLVREKGFTLEGARKELSASKTSYDQKRKVIAKLTSLRQRLEALRQKVEKMP